MEKLNNNLSGLNFSNYLDLQKSINTNSYSIRKSMEKINNNNYETNKELIEKIQDLLDNNPEIKDSIDEELLTKFEDVKTSVNDFDIDNNKTFVKIVSIVLVVVFSALIFWIFKKEEK